MKKLPLLVVALSALVITSCSDPAADAKQHYQALESIMTENVDKPEQGVDQLIAYMEANGAEIAAAEMGMVMSIASIEKDGDRAERIKEVKEHLETSSKNFDGTAEKFFKAVMTDKAASEKLDAFQKRTREAREAGIGIGMGMF